MFGNVPHQSFILYLNFLSDERPHAVRQTLALERATELRQCLLLQFSLTKIKLSFGILLSGLHKQQFLVCIGFVSVNHSSCPIIAVIKG